MAQSAAHAASSPGGSDVTTSPALSALKARAARPLSRDTVLLAFKVVREPGARPLRATLSCWDQKAQATGYLAAAPESACELAVQLRGLLLVNGPDAGQVCAPVTSGPEAARVVGLIGGERVHRTFSRTDSCATRDWGLAAGLLGGPGQAPPPPEPIPTD